MAVFDGSCYLFHGSFHGRVPKPAAAIYGGPTAFPGHFTYDLVGPRYIAAAPRPRRAGASKPPLCKGRCHQSADW